LSGFAFGGALTTALGFDELDKPCSNAAMLCSASIIRPSTSLLGYALPMRRAKIAKVFGSFFKKEQLNSPDST
jgi:hypothetical protein